MLRNFKKKLQLIGYLISAFCISLIFAFLSSGAAIAAPEDFSRLSFSDFPAIETSGSVNVEGFSRQWQAGETPDMFLTLGDVQSLGGQSLSIDTISEATGQGFSGVSISEFGLLAQQTLGSLSDAIPDLEQYSIQDIPVLLDLLTQRGELSGIGNNTLGQVLEANPALRGLKLNEIDLQQYSVNSIPGASSIPISEYEGWEEAAISEIPGLNTLPLQSFPDLRVEGGPVLRIDFVHGPEEAERTNTISGSDVEGFRVPCTIGNSDCAYIQLDDLENEGRSAQGPLEGVQWISGKYQEVEGGHGFLRMVNGGKEPTGRLPFGDAFKVVIWEPDETTDSVTTALFTRFCFNAANCTPYFIGPIPFLTFRRDDLIFVGLITPENVSSNSSTPTGATKGGGFPPMTTYNGGFSSGGGTCTIDPTKLDSVTKAAIESADPAAREGAPNMIPYIMQACAEAGITDTDQLAYILATAEHETDHYRTMREYGNPQYDSCGGGEGMIQVTWCSNKERVFRKLGLPAYAGRSDTRLQQPEIAAQALCRGMKEGWYTGVALPECIGGGRVDHTCARRVVNGTDRWQLIGVRANRYKAGLAGAADDPTTGSTESAIVCQSPGGAGGAGGGSPISGGDVPAGEVNQRIMQAIDQNWGMNTKDCPGTNNGILACACGVNRMLMRAGMSPIGTGREGTYSVSELHDGLRNGRGTEVSAQQSQPGDLIILYGSNGNRHTGFCANAGCTQAVSNSSSNGAFTWRSDGYFSPSYGPQSRRHIYRVNP